MERNKKEVHVLYEFLAEKMLEHCNINPVELSVAKAEWVMTRYRIPKDICPLVLKEMEQICLLKKINRERIQIYYNKKPIQERANKLSHDLGLW